MYLMYVDESGDNGDPRKNGSRFFIVSGLIVHLSQWNEFLQEVKNFRVFLRDRYKFHPTYELHSKELLMNSGFFKKKKVYPRTRVDVYKETLKFLSKQRAYVKLMNVCVDKSKEWKSKQTFVEQAWKLLIQRFDNFVYEEDSHGFILSDVGYRRLSQRVYRKMRVYNPLPSRKEPGTYYDKPVRLIIEDPNWKYSRESSAIQLVDIACNAVKLKKAPTKKAQKRGYCDMWKLLDPIMVPDISKTKDGILDYP